MITKTTTKCIIGITALILIIYDICAYSSGGSDPTLSRVIYHAAEDFPIISFAAGLLCGHLFSPQRIPNSEI